MTESLSCRRHHEIAARPRASAISSWTSANLQIAAEHVGDLGMAAASDEEILDAARQRQAVVDTRDADFHAILAMKGATAPSVIRIRREGLKGAALATLLEDVMRAVSLELNQGAAVSVTDSSIRVRLLPLI